MRRNQFAIAVLIGHVTLLAFAGWCHSPVVDETPHLVSGLAHYELGRFDLFCANPPLVRMIAAAPLSFLGTEVDWKNYDDSPGARAEFDVARDFSRLHGMETFRLHAIARWACVPISLLGGLICWRWGRALYGETAGIVSLALWCFCPNILANAHLVLPDPGATVLGLLAMYAFWLWLREPRWELALFAGAALGLAELTKFTWVILFALWPLLWCVWRPARPSAIQLIAILVLSIAVINAGYAFEGSFERLGSYRFVSKALKAPDAPMATTGNRFAGTWLAEVPVPLPHNYVAGIDSVKIAFESSRLAYLGGEFRSGGWWYYYLYALALKVPLGMGVLIVLALGISARRLYSRQFSSLAGERSRPDSGSSGSDFLKSDFEGAPQMARLPDSSPGRMSCSLANGASTSPPLSKGGQGGWGEVSLGSDCILNQRDGASSPDPLRLPLAKGERNASLERLLKAAQPPRGRMSAMVSREERGPEHGAHSWRDTLVLLAPLVVLLVFVSANSGINRHLRYVLPTLPFAFIWVSQVARGVSSGPLWVRRGFAVTVAFAVTWFVVASLSVFPHCGSYFNEVAGGPRRGHEHLVSSNIDWGQDLLFLKRWYQSHPEARPFRLAYYGAIDPAIAGIEFSAPPIGPHPDGRLPELKHEEIGPVPGWHAISVHILAGSPSIIPDGTGKRKQLDVHDYSYFRKFEPVAMAGYSIAIYHISVEEAERGRRELGLRPWSECLPDLSRTSQNAATGEDS